MEQLYPDVTYTLPTELPEALALPFAHQDVARCVLASGDRLSQEDSGDVGQFPLCLFPLWL